MAGLVLSKGAFRIKEKKMKGVLVKNKFFIYW